MASNSSHDQLGKITRLQAATEKRRASDQLKEQKEMKRAKEMFASRKLIGPRDIIVNADPPKIKLEEDMVSPVKEENVEEISRNLDDSIEIDEFIQTWPLKTETSVDHNVIISDTRTNENSSDNNLESENNQFSQNHIQLLETLVAQKDQEIDVLNELIKGLQQQSSKDKPIGLDDPNNKYRIMQLVTKHSSDLSDRDAQISGLSTELHKLQDDKFGNTNGKFVQESFKQILQLLYPELNLNDILSCRRVCREWNFATDIFLNTHPFLLPFDKEVHSQEMRKLEFGRIPTWKESPIEEFTKAYNFSSLHELNIFTQNTKFQILGSTVCFENILLEKPFRFMDLKRFLATFCSRISYLKIRQSVELSNFRLDYLMERLKQCFRELANLKGCSIVLYKNKKKIRTEKCPDLLRKMHADAVSYAEYETWHVDSFPRLENFSSLAIQVEDFDGWILTDRSLLSKFSTSLVQSYSKQLKQLSIFADGYNRKYSLDAPNLVQLTIPLRELVELRCENVQKCTFTGKISGLGHSDIVKIQQTFPKLTCLGLKFYFSNRRTDEYRWRTEIPTLPSVQTLDLVDCSAVAYSGLGRFPNLRYINIIIQEIRTDKDYVGDATFHIAKLWQGGNLYDDKLFWERFPNISVVSLNFCGDPKTNLGPKVATWTRQCYLRYQYKNITL